MGKLTLSSAVVAASLVGTSALAKDGQVQPKLTPSQNSAEFCRELSNVSPSTLSLNAPGIVELSYSREDRRCGRARIDSAVRREVEVSVAGTHASITCIYKGHELRDNMFASSIHVDDIDTPAYGDFYESNCNYDSHSSYGCGGDINGLLSMAVGPSSEDSRRSKYPTLDYGLITPEDQKRYDAIMKAAREALRRATSSSDR